MQDLYVVYGSRMSRTGNSTISFIGRTLLSGYGSTLYSSGVRQFFTSSGHGEMSNFSVPTNYTNGVSHTDSFRGPAEEVSQQFLKNCVEYLVYFRNYGCLKYLSLIVKLTRYQQLIICHLLIYFSHINSS